MGVFLQGRIGRYARCFAASPTQFCNRSLSTAKQLSSVAASSAILHHALSAICCCSAKKSESSTTP